MNEIRIVFILQKWYKVTYTVIRYFKYPFTPFALFYNEFSKCDFYCIEIHIRNFEKV